MNLQARTLSSLDALRAAGHITAESEGLAELALVLAAALDEAGSPDPAKAREYRILMTTLAQIPPRDPSGFEDFTAEAGQVS